MEKTLLINEECLCRLTYEKSLKISQEFLYTTKQNA